MDFISKILINFIISIYPEADIKQIHDYSIENDDQKLFIIMLKKHVMVISFDNETHVDCFCVHFDRVFDLLLDLFDEDGIELYYNLFQTKQQFTLN